MRMTAGEIGVDADKIFKYTAISCEGMWNPKYGIRDMGPFSGSCLPKDTKAFLDWAKNRNFDAVLLESVIDVNNALSRKMGVKNNHEAEYTL